MVRRHKFNKDHLSWLRLGAVIIWGDLLHADGQKGRSGNGQHGLAMETSLSGNPLALMCLGRIYREVITSC